VILGAENGSGKSALIKLLCREIYPVVKPGSWLRLFGHQTANLWNLRARIGLVSQDLQGQLSKAALLPAMWCSSGFFGSGGHRPEPAAHSRPQAEVG